MKSELLGLASALRARVENAEESEFLPGLGASVTRTGPVDRALPAAGEPLPAPGTPEALARLEQLKARVLACRECPLGSQRLNPAFGVGSPTAKVMFVGEGPGYQEDRQGEPFVGKAGQLLDKILASIGLSRRTVYIANVVKCHAMTDPSTPEARGNDRPPTPQEAQACRHYLDEQIRLIGPRVIVTLGASATKALLGEDLGISRIRGAWRDLRLSEDEPAIRLLPTYHPAALLRNPDLKRDVWNDMKSLRQALEEMG